MFIFKICVQVMIPTVEEIQQAVNQLTDLVLNVSKGVTWPREYIHDGTEDKGKSVCICVRAYICVQPCKIFLF